MLVHHFRCIMKHWVILTILYFLVGRGLCQREWNHEMNLINRLNHFFGFDHNIYFLDTLTDNNRMNLAMCNNDWNFTAQTVYIFNPNLVGNKGTKLSTVRSLTSKKPFLIIMATSLQFKSSIRLLSQMKQRCDTNVHIGVFYVSKVTSMNLVQQLLRWSWSNGFANFFCAFYSKTWNDSSAFNVFGYDPFVTLDLINLTESESLQNYFPSGVPNYRGHPLRCARADFSHLDDVEDKFWDTVIRVFNASRSEVLYSTGDENVNADILLHERNFDDTQCPCYPHRILTLVLMVPHARPYSDFVAYLQNATWNLLFIYTFLTVAAASLVLIISGYLQTNKISLFKCVTDIINLLMSDNGAIRYGQLKRADVFIIVSFSFAGLIVVNGIFSVFQSYLSVPIYERQINTINDLFKSSVKIFVEHSWENNVIEMLEDLSHHGGWGNKVRSTNSTEIFEEVEKYNQSIAFVGFSNEIRLYLETQKRLEIKAYHSLSEPYLEKGYVGFMVFRNFPFIEPVNDLVHRLLCAGLIQKWLIDADYTMLNNMSKKNIHLRVETNVEPGSIGGEFGVPNFVWCGWIGSVILFICEIAWYRLKSQIKRMSKRKKQRKIGHCTAL